MVQETSHGRLITGMGCAILLALCLTGCGTNVEQATTGPAPTDLQFPEEILSAANGIQPTSLLEAISGAT